MPTGCHASISSDVTLLPCVKVRTFPMLYVLSTPARLFRHCPLFVLVRQVARNHNTPRLPPLPCPLIAHADQLLLNYLDPILLLKGEQQLVSRSQQRIPDCIPLFTNLQCR